ncbi:MAG: hypothetical protein U5K29_15530 [Acidimicrobiales bacterium]|nr:hypothetical protein [Acidimicrobiales bacterium]
MTHAPKRTWVRPSVTPLTNPDSRSDTPDVAARNGNDNGVVLSPVDT